MASRIDVEEVYSKRSGGGVLIDLVTTTGKTIRVAIDHLQLADLLGGTLESLRIGETPVARVHWHPEADVVVITAAKSD